MRDEVTLVRFAAALLRFLLERRRAVSVEVDPLEVRGKTFADYPEIVLEVVHTSPLLDKLDVYAAMGVAEVWIFRDGAFAIHALDRGAGRYVDRPSSALLPGLDFGAVGRHAVRTDTPQALREFEAEIGDG